MPKRAHFSSRPSGLCLVLHCSPSCSSGRPFFSDCLRFDLSLGLAALRRSFPYFFRPSSQHFTPTPPHLKPQLPLQSLPQLITTLRLPPALLP